MALIKGNLIAEASGKMGGVVFAHNSGGQYVRQFRVPTNPNTAAQQARRALFGQTSIRWRETLTAAQRAAWDAIAPTITATNALGDTIQLNGQQAYIRAATLAQLAGVTPPDNAPTDTGETPLGTITLSLVEEGLTEIGIGGTPPWAASTSGRLLVFNGRQVSAATNFYKGPFLYESSIPGEATPINSGSTANNFTTGSYHFVRMLAILNGRVSQQVILNTGSVA